MKMYLLIVFLAILGMTSSASVRSSASSNHALFSSKLFHNIANGKVQENVVLSPFSIQTCLALTYLGAGGKTAEEMESGLLLNGSNKKEFKDSFGQFLKAVPDKHVKVANKIYANKGLPVNSQFNTEAKEIFNSHVENIDFVQSDEAVREINHWVADKTNGKIQDLLEAGSVDGETSAILVNAIHFKAEWAIEFAALATRKADFWISPTQSVQVDTMSEEDDFKYAALDDLDATALEMDYKDSNLSMLILLPNQNDGLKSLEGKLKNVDLLALAEKLKVEDVQLKLPKFKAEFSVQLKGVLEQMGMRTMFTNAADFTNMFDNRQRVKITEVFHKAFVSVDEAGTEASAATYAKAYPMSLNYNQKRFNANHPFVWIIKDKHAVYFMGHVSKF